MSDLQKKINDFTETTDPNVDSSVLIQTPIGTTLRSKISNILKKIDFLNFEDTTIVDPSDKILIQKGTTVVSVPVSAVSSGSVLAGYWIKRNTGYTANNLDNILANTSTSAWTLLLPAAPAVGSEVHIADAEGTWDINYLTISGNGKNIYEEPTLVMDTKNDHVKLVFDGSIWKIA